MPEFIYRFRSINNLLGKQELENQEIFFAQPEKLNDPMEGFKDIFWRGDLIAWNNLLKHYLLCLEHMCLLFVLSGETHQINRDDIPIFKTIKDFPTPEYKTTFNEICDLFFNNEAIQQYASLLSTRSGPVRRNELIVHIKFIHIYALDVIFSVYENHNFVNKRENNRELPKITNFIMLFDLMNKLEKEHPEKDFADMLFGITKDIFKQFDLILSYNSADSGSNNKNFIFAEFPEEYIRQIEKIVYPDWFTACFMSECSNSSIWGNYGDNHRGVCLKFKTMPENNNLFIKLHGIIGYGGKGPIYGNRHYFFYKIDYSNKFTEIDFFKSIGRLSKPDLLAFWYTDTAGKRSSCSNHIFDDHPKWVEQYWANFYKGITVKLEDWDYEKEYRLILTSFISDFSNPVTRKLKYDFNDLDGIVFGIKTPNEDKVQIIKIIESKCQKENRKDFKFYQAYYSKETGNINHVQLGLLKFAD